MLQDWFSLLLLTGEAPLRDSVRGAHYSGEGRGRRQHVRARCASLAVYSHNPALVWASIDATERVKRLLSFPSAVWAVFAESSWFSHVSGDESMLYALVRCRF